MIFNLSVTHLSSPHRVIVFPFTAVTVSRCDQTQFSNPTTAQALLMNIKRLTIPTLLGNPLGVLLRNLINIHEPRLQSCMIRQHTQRPPACQPIRKSSLSNVTLRN